MLLPKSYLGCIFLLAGGLAAAVEPSAPPPAAPAAASSPAPAPLAAGPMLGYNEMRAAAIWVQTAAPATVQIAYWPKDAPAQRELTAAVATRTADACTATLVTDRVRPGVRYAYQVLVDGQPVALDFPTEFTTLPDWRERGNPPDFSIAFAWGNFVFDPAVDPPQYAPTEGLYTILAALQAKRPDALVWLGGGTWLREADWGSRAGLLRRYSQTRALPEMRPLLATTPQYAVMGGPDYGPPGADANLWNLRDTAGVFQLFWPNPSFGVARLEGFMTTFRWGDADFFLLDDRTRRDSGDLNQANRRMLGNDQLAWLGAALRQSTATFKIICSASPILNPVGDPANLAAAPGERDQLINLLRDPQLRGVLFVTGGKPYGEVSRLPRAQFYDLHDITVGPLTTRPADSVTEANFLRVPNTQKAARQFVLLQFSGPPNQRLLTITVCDALGRSLFGATLAAASLGWNGL